MVFIVGGKAQGKLRYAEETFGLKSGNGDVCNGASCTPDELSRAACIDGLQEFLRRFPDFTNLESLNLRQDAIVICDEIGAGVIPTDRQEREWRERTGNIGCQIAQKSESVIRLVFGIPVKLK